jgi:ribosomal protein S27E
MNPFFHFVLSHTVAKSLARVCPSCKRTQVVAQSKADVAVPCERCGKPIPPKPKTTR